MIKIIGLINNIFPVIKKTKKYLPFFIGLKLITFTGFLTYIMNQQKIMDLPNLQWLQPLLAFERKYLLT